MDTDADQRRWFLLFVRPRGQSCYVQQASGTNDVELMGDANRAMLRGAEAAIVVEEIYSADAVRWRKISVT